MIYTSEWLKEQEKIQAEQAEALHKDNYIYSCHLIIIGLLFAIGALAIVAYVK